MLRIDNRDAPRYIVALVEHRPKWPNANIINDLCYFTSRCIIIGIKCLFQNRLPVHRQLLFGFPQRLHAVVQFGEQFLDPGNDALLFLQ